ncbi:MAG: alkaline phosphatase family protein [Acidobacteria bacterium]|nr:alkaline phosphatase family protein [Acidobacteriota bacterium]
MKCQSLHFALVLLIAFSIDSIAQQSSNNPQVMREKKVQEKPLPLTSCVVLISIDGLRNEDFNNPRLNLPNLKSRRDRGSYVLNIESVYPSLSLPAHATIATGMFPSDHGIISDWKFDEKTGTRSEEFFGDPGEIKAETIWQTTKRAGIKTAAINFPFINPAEVDYASPDLNKALAWVEKNRPQLILIRFDDLGNSIQRAGIGSTAAYSSLEKIDAAVKTISDSIERAGLTDETSFLIVSSHGYAKVEQEFRPNIVLAKKGFITTGDKGMITNWIASVYSSSGSAAIYLKDARNEEAAKQIENIFEEIHKQESSPIWRIISKKDIAKIGADPRASFFIEAAPGFSISDGITEKKITEKVNGKTGQATSGYSPSRSEMRGAFIAAGKGIKSKTQIEYARLTDIAPTIARLLGLELKASRGHTISEILIPQNRK